MPTFNPKRGRLGDQTKTNATDVRIARVFIPYREVLSVDPLDDRYVIPYTGAPGEVVVGYAIHNPKGTPAGERVHVLQDELIEEDFGGGPALATPTFNLVSPNLTYTDAHGNATTINLATFLDDVNILSTTYNPTTYDFTITETDGTIHTVNLATLVDNPLCDDDGDTCIKVEDGSDFDHIQFETAGTKKMEIGPTGHVGIGKDDQPNVQLLVREDGGEYTIVAESPAVGGNPDVALSVDGDIKGQLVYVAASKELRLRTDASTTGYNAPLAYYMDISGVNGDVQFSAYPNTRNDGKTKKALFIGSDNHLDYGDIEAPALMVDADGDTSITVEDVADEDKIRMDIAGTEKVLIENGQICISDYPDSRNDVATDPPKNFLYTEKNGCIRSAKLETLEIHEAFGLKQLDLTNTFQPNFIENDRYNDHSWVSNGGNVLKLAEGRYLINANWSGDMVGNDSRTEATHALFVDGNEVKGACFKTYHRENPQGGSSGTVEVYLKFTTTITIELRSRRSGGSGTVRTDEACVKLIVKRLGDV